ncbi:Na/Pi cotransporter family protein [Aquabacterium sp.]|uniref:Na/Pi cotransporter family protein n=1 Tax=Aquabacterium sp. TaxID=1872578 RepID=UPI004037A7D3
MDGLLTWIFSVLAAIMLFLHGLSAFSDEMSRLGGERLRLALQRLTRSDWRGSLLGAVFTALVQSSSAVTSMAVGLANNRTLTERSAVSVMIGANVGTTLTAWLVAMKVSGLGPLFVTLGCAWSLIGPRPWRPYGKALFYFGLIFLALDLISQGLAPLAAGPWLAQRHAALGSPLLALLAGAVLTGLVQSSSVVSGLAVLPVSQTVLAPGVAVWLVAGANIGTTSTAFLASSALDATARRLALLNTGFNVLGVLLFATVLQPLIAWILRQHIPPAQQVALVHSVFNLAAAMAALALLPPMWPRLETWMRSRS